MPATRIDPETGHLGIVGSIPDGGTRIASARQIYGVFSGPDGERLMSEIAQDCINRGQRVPLAIKAMRQVRDKETHEEAVALNNVEQLRRKRLWRERATGVLTESEYQKQLKEGSIL